MSCACQPVFGPHAPRHYLVITHPALNRVTFFDLDAGKVVGALPAQKLPHDMLLSPDERTLYVVSSGAQCITKYHLGAPELWREAQAFTRHDTSGARVRGAPGTHSPAMFGMGGGADSAPSPHPRVAVPGRVEAPPVASEPPRGSGPVYLNPNPTQTLPPQVAEFHLTDATFPDRARVPHERTRATEHRTCFDCHDRSLGAKPFGPAFSQDGASIDLVHLAYRNITVLDAATLAIRRQVPLDVPPHYAPVEAWVRPGSGTAFVTCRDEIGQSRRGVILVVDLESGATLETIPAGIYPWHMLPDPTGTRLYVNNFQSSRISVVDVARRQVVDSLVVQNGPSTMLLSPDGARLFVSCFYTHKVLVVNLGTRKVEREIAVGSNPTSLLLSADRRRLLVLCGGESTLELVDLPSSTVRERHSLLFGAYAFQLVDRDRSGRWAVAAGTLVPHAPTHGVDR